MKLKYHRKRVVFEKRIPDPMSLRFRTSHYQTDRLLDIDLSESEGKPDARCLPKSTIVFFSGLIR